jgi:DNA-binding Lrp family transcriptional regulator
VAEKVGITERAAQRIVAELESEGYLSHVKVGRRNHYEVHTDMHLRHPLEDHLAIGALLRVLVQRD